MRVAPVSGFKPRNSIPNEGTNLRAIYDLFHSSKGRVIDFSASHERPLSDLQDYYGLDIRRVGHRKWVLAGEWFGKVYVDYVCEHLTSKGVA